MGYSKLLVRAPLSRFRLVGETCRITMLAEIDGGMIIGLLILAPLVLWLLGWIYALVRGTGRAARYYTTKNPDTKRKIERKIERGLRERGLANEVPLGPDGLPWSMEKDMRGDYLQYLEQDPEFVEMAQDPYGWMRKHPGSIPTHLLLEEIKANPDMTREEV